MKPELFGILNDGREVEGFVLSSAMGVGVRVIALGATIQSVVTPDKQGKMADIALGYDTPQEYLEGNSVFGATVGRYANRIGRAQFELDGEVYRLPANDGSNLLHGGAAGFDKALWTVERFGVEGDTAFVSFSHLSLDGDQGFPGELRVTVKYSIDNENNLYIEYSATTSKPTVVNLTNHSYWNLAGEGTGDVLQQELRLASKTFTPVDANMIPTGEERSVTGTPFDFRESLPIGRAVRRGDDPQIRLARGLDQNFVLSCPPSTPDLAAARLYDPHSGRMLELRTTEPGLQVYSGNYLNGAEVGKSGRLYRQSDAICLEPQHYPDSPNQPGFPSVVLRPGETYRSSTTIRFGVEPDFFG